MPIQENHQSFAPLNLNTTLPGGPNCESFTQGCHLLPTTSSFIKSRRRKKEKRKKMKKNSFRNTRRKEGRDTAQRWQATVLFLRGWCRHLPKLCRWVGGSTKTNSVRLIYLSHLQRCGVYACWREWKHTSNFETSREVNFWIFFSNRSSPLRNHEIAQGRRWRQGRMVVRNFRR